MPRKEEKFKFGHEADVYYDMAVKKLKEKYYWATRETMDKSWRYAIEEVDGAWQFVSYNTWREGECDRIVHPDCDTAAKIIERIIMNNEDCVAGANQIIDTYKVQYYPVETSGGWQLERYEFRKHQYGDYSAMIQAGDRLTGSSREFFIPQKIMGGTYGEFLEAYLHDGPGHGFRLEKDELLADGGLKAFLGFTPVIPHPEITLVEMPEMTIIGDYEFCQGSRYLPLKLNVKPEKRDGISNLRSAVMNMAVELTEDTQGKTGLELWGIMSDDLPVNGLTPWKHHYKTGYYMAGLKANLLPRPPMAWTKWTIPAATCAVANVGPDNYDEVFYEYVNRIIPEMGMKIDGAVCECFVPGDDKMTLFFPVTWLI